MLCGARGWNPASDRASLERAAGRAEEKVAVREGSSADERSARTAAKRDGESRPAEGGPNAAGEPKGGVGRKWRRNALKRFDSGMHIEHEGRDEIERQDPPQAIGAGGAGETASLSRSLRSRSK